MQPPRSGTLQLTINGITCSHVRVLAPNDFRVNVLFAPSDLDIMLQPAPPPTFTGGWYHLPPITLNTAFVFFNIALKRYNTSFTLPSAFFKQLAQRQLAYPVPWSARDEVASWLAPSRLLLHPFVGKSLADDAPRMFIDGGEVALSAAFNSRGTRVTRAVLLAFCIYGSGCSIYFSLSFT